MSDKELKALKSAVVKAEAALARKKTAHEAACKKHHESEEALCAAHCAVIDAQKALISALCPAAC